MWTTPSFDELRSTLEDPTSPIGKRMRAAYHCKQLFVNSAKATNQDDNKDGNDDEEEILLLKNGKQEEDIVHLLCTQVFQREHGSLLRHEFAYVLGQMQTPEACQALQTLLLQDDDCVMVRHEAAEALGAIAVNYYNDNNNNDDSSTKAILKKVYEQYTGNLDELADTCRLALHRLEQENEEKTAVGCACTMAPYSSVDPIEADPQHESLTTTQIGNILCNPQEDLLERYRAMFSLRNRGGEAAVQELCRALLEDTSSPLLRHEVAFVLGQLQHPSSISALQTSLSNIQEHVMVRHESAEALGAIDVTHSEQWQSIESILTKYQQDPILPVAESCVVALDAADYWGHSNNNDDDNHEKEEEGKSDNREEEVSLPYTGPSGTNLLNNFGHQKRMDEQQQQQCRKDVLAHRFNLVAKQ